MNKKKEPIKKLDEQILKMMTKKFDWELVFNIDLSFNELFSIKSWENCINLIYLNISNNKIISISEARYFKKLAFLDASFNNLEELPPLSDSLVKLKWESNNIKDIDSIRDLNNCINLKYFSLKTISNEHNNPICNKKKYPDIIFKSFPKIKILDYLSQENYNNLSINSKIKDDQEFNDSINNLKKYNLNNKETNDQLFSWTQKLEKIYSKEDKIIDHYNQSSDKINNINRLLNKLDNNINNINKLLD